jgi:hypothetical protein
MHKSFAYNQAYFHFCQAAFLGVAITFVVVRSASAEEKPSVAERPEKPEAKSPREPKWLPIGELLAEAIVIEFNVFVASPEAADPMPPAKIARKETWICLRGILPRGKQIDEIAAALEVDRDHREQYFEVIDFAVERQEAIIESKQPEWDKLPWKKVSFEKSLDALNEAENFDIDVINLSESHQAVTSPLPALAKGKWDHRVTHPRLKDNQPPANAKNKAAKPELPANGKISTARNVLFRFFDVEIQPGCTYRYRVKITSLNPAFSDENVPREVAEGETRDSPWSAPSPAVTVEKSAK